MPIKKCKPFKHNIRLTLKLGPLKQTHWVSQNVWHNFSPSAFLSLDKRELSGHSQSCRCTRAAVLSAVNAHTFSSSTDLTSSSFSRSSLTRWTSRCLGAPDTVGSGISLVYRLTQHNSTLTPLKFLQTVSVECLGHGQTTSTVVFLSGLLLCQFKSKQSFNSLLK